MIFRMYFEIKGGHVHCSFFAGPQEGSLGKWGNLCMPITEFQSFREVATFVQFLEIGHDG